MNVNRVVVGSMAVSREINSSLNRHKKNKGRGVRIDGRSLLLISCLLGKMRQTSGGNCCYQWNPRLIFSLSEIDAESEMEGVSNESRLVMIEVYEQSGQ